MTSPKKMLSVDDIEEQMALELPERTMLTTCSLQGTFYGWPVSETCVSGATIGAYTQLSCTGTLFNGSIYAKTSLLNQAVGHSITLYGLTGACTA